MKTKSIRILEYSLLAAALLSCARPATAGEGHRSSDENISVSTADEVRACSDIHVQFEERDAVRAEESLTGAGLRGPLTVSLPKDAGAFVRGTDRRDWLVLACKAAVSAEALAAIHTTFDRGELESRGPQDGKWLVYYVIEAPRNAEIEAASHNGPLEFADFAGARILARAENGPVAFRRCAGTIDAGTQNGPLSLAGVSGDVRVHAENGPISISAGSGNVKAETQNGPISVRLSGDSWRDGRLDVHAVNGSLTLKIPSGYRSGTLVESSGHSPLSCRGGACDTARRTSDDDSRRIAFGDGDNLVRLSTVNGPVSIDSSRSE